MSENSKIEWCDHTYNPWIGCTKVSPGCANCYAEKSTRARVLRAGGQETWGKGATRSRTKTQDDPRKWNRQAEQDLAEWQQHSDLHGGMPHYPKPRRPRVFCASLADWLDDEVPVEWLADLLQLIHDTPYLDWLLLTKRPQNFRVRVLAASFHLSGFRDGQTSENPIAPPMSAWEMACGWSRLESCPANVWLGTTCEDQTRADQRIPELLAIPAAVRFLSCEPLLGPLDLREWMEWRDTVAGSSTITNHRSISWVIAGGESGPGPKIRPMHPAWARDLRDQCQAADVPFLFKQWGEWMPRTLGEMPAAQLDDPKQPRIRLSIDGKNAQTEACDGDEDVWMGRCGKKAAGRMLDGRTWDEFPEVATVATEGGNRSANPATSPA